MTPEIDSIVKALSHLVWADGRLDPREEKMAHKLFLKMGLHEHEVVAALQQDAAGPPDLDELARIIPNLAGRHKLVKLLLELSFVDDAMTFEEFSLVETVTRLFQVSDGDLDALREEVLQGRK